MDTKLKNDFRPYKLKIDCATEDDSKGWFKLDCYIPNFPDELLPTAIEKVITYEEFQNEYADSKGKIQFTPKDDPENCYEMPFWKWFADHGWRDQYNLLNDLLNKKEGRYKEYAPGDKIITSEDFRESLKCVSALPDVFETLGMALKPVNAR